MEIEIKDGPEVFNQLEDDWRRLSANTDDDRYDLLFEEARSAWQMYARRGGYALRVVVGYEYGRPVLIWPIMVHKWLVWRRGVWLGVSHANREVSTEDTPEREIWIGTVWKHIKSELGTDMIWCPGVRQNTAMYPLLEKETSAAAMHGKTLFLPIHEWSDWESFYASLKAKYRSGHRRRLRRLSEVGDVSFECVDRPEEIDRVLDWALGHKSQWSNRIGAISTFTEENLPYFKDSAKQANRAGSLVLGTLKLDGALIAVALGTVRGSRFDILNTAYDRDWLAYGPGRLMWEQMLKWGFDRKVKTIDFKSGTESYKYTFNPDTAALNSYLVPCSAWGRFYVAWYRSPIRRLIKAVFGLSPTGLKRVVKNILIRP